MPRFLALLRGVNYEAAIIGWGMKRRGNPFGLATLVLHSIVAHNCLDKIWHRSSGAPPHGSNFIGIVCCWPRFARYMLAQCSSVEVSSLLERSWLSFLFGSNVPCLVLPFAFADWGHSREAIDGWMKHGASRWVGHPSPPLGCSSRRSMDG